MRRFRPISSRVVSVCALAVGCAPSGTPVTPAAPQTPTTGEAFAGDGQVSCSAVRPQSEPDLMAWDAGSRMSLNTLRKRGVVAVRYSAQGCNVELEVLPNCIGKGSYEYEPYASSDTKLAKNAQELYAQLPLGAARLVGKLQGNRALRTDYVLVGMVTLPPGSTYPASDLTGPDCTRATHVVSRAYLGGFAMEAGEAQALEAGASAFGVGGGAERQASAERVFYEGTPEACAEAQKTGEPQALCSVPLRIGLLAVEGAGMAACPEGATWDGARCVKKQVETVVECPGGAKWDGERCAATVSTDCAAGLRFEAGRGCVPVTVAAAPPPSPVPAATQPSAPAAVPTGRGPAMVRIPAGTFWMGSNDGDDDEKPVHQVTVSAFEMDVTEVTVAQYRSCVSAGTCELPDSADDCNFRQSGKDNHPMNCVDWSEATQFCGWAGKRLPTEAEWEYAARGSDGRVYPWGNDAPGSQLCWKRRDPELGTCRVASFPKGDSPFGLHDMAGNVWEWTSTPYCSSYYPGASCATDRRVSRGGCWHNVHAEYVHAADRGGAVSAGGIGTSGFRCARS